jgi:hypothetical protein
LKIRTLYSVICIAVQCTCIYHICQIGNQYKIAFKNYPEEFCILNLTYVVQKYNLYTNRIQNYLTNVLFNCKIYYGKLETSDDQ